MLVVLGPTATGKTPVSVEIAVRLGGEIVSADSRAFYQGLDIVTDKPDMDARRGVPHHLIDRVPWNASYDVMTFRNDVVRLLPQIRQRDRLPLLAGGGTLYLGAVLRGVFEGPSKDDVLRSQMARRSSEELWAELGEIDPASAERIHPKDRLRLERALEVFHASGTPISRWRARAKPLVEAFHIVGLLREPSDHRNAIESRVRRMLARGVLDEVAALREKGLSSQMQAYRTIGVPEAVEVLEGRSTVDAYVEQVTQATWQLARRQMSWFRRDRNVLWVDVTRRAVSAIADEVVAALPQEVSR